jgi:hypothetical protein
MLHKFFHNLILIKTLLDFIMANNVSITQGFEDAQMIEEQLPEYSLDLIFIQWPHVGKPMQQEVWP